MRYSLVSISLALFILSSENRGYSQEVQADLFLTPETSKVGDLLQLKLELKFADGYQFQIPDLKVALLPMEVGNPRITRERIEGGMTTEIHSFETFVFDTGRIVIPSQKIVYWHGLDTTIRKDTQTDTVWIYVQSLLTADASDIRDIKEPIEIPQPFDRWWLVILLLAILTVALIVYYFWRKRSDKPIVPFKKKKDIRPAHEIALESLRILKEKRLIENNQVDRYYTALSKILREYIENRYFLKALEMTTTEVLDAIERAGLYEKIGEGVKEVLSESDLVKFARFIPNKSVGDRLISDTVTMVDKTKIVPVVNKSGQKSVSVSEGEDKI